MILPASNSPWVSTIRIYCCRLFRLRLAPSIVRSNRCPLSAIPIYSYPRQGGFGKEVFMWLALAFVFLIAWLIGFIGFHVAVGAFHILLGLFVLFLIIHFVRGAARHA